MDWSVRLPRQLSRYLLLAALSMLCLCAPLAAQPATIIDAWRAEADRIRILIDNDAPEAYRQARYLHDILPADAPATDRARALNLLARAELYLAMTGPADEHARAAHELAANHGDRVGQVEANLVLTLNAINAADIPTLRQTAVEAMELVRDLNRPELQSEAMLRVAMMYMRVGEFDAAITLAMQTLDIAQRSGDQKALAHAYHGMAIVHDLSGSKQQALEYYEGMRQAAGRADSLILTAVARRGQGSVLTDLGDLRQGERRLHEALESYRRFGGPFYVAHGLFGLAVNLAQQGRRREAAALYDQVVAIYEGRDIKIGLWWTLGARSDNLQALGRHEAARADAERARDLAREIGLLTYQSDSAKRLARLFAGQGDFQGAYALSSDAADLADKAAREKTSERIVELGRLYQEESLRRELEQLHQRDREQTAALAQQVLRERWLATMLAAGVVLLVVTAFFTFRLRRSREEIRALNTGLERRVQERTAELYESQQRLAEAQRIAHIGSWELDLVTDALRWSDEVYRIFETDPQRFGGTYKTFLEAIHPEDRERVDRVFRESVGKQALYEIEHRLALPDGRIKYVHEHCETTYDENGKPLRSLGTVQDVTERRRLEADLRDSHNFLDSVINSLPDPIFVKDRQHRWILLNDANCSLTGLSRDVLIGKSDHDIFPRHEADVFWEKDEIVFESGEVNLNEESFTSADGVTHFIQTKKTPFVAADGSQMLVGVIRDITERKNYEAAREAALAEAVRLARLRGEFLAHMSHELRTPLNSLLGFTQFLARDRSLTERQQESVTVIRESGEHLLGLIEDILDYARIESGGLELVDGDIRLDPFLHMIGEMIAVKARQKGLEFTVELAPKLPQVVHGDEKRLRQILLNLLSNAVKFTDCGRVRLRAERPAGGRMRFEIADTGVGIDAQALETIFEAFVQTGDLLHRQGGAGLGLAISRQLARMMGGDITVESRPGEGSVFRLELAAGEGHPEGTTGHHERSPLMAIEPGAEITPPPRETIETLHRLAELGNMGDIVRETERIAALDPRYHAFAMRLRRLAEGYESKALVALVEQYMNESSI